MSEHISETVSAGQLRAFIERIERLEEEKKTIADDIKEVKAEAKGSGFSVAIINEIIKLRKKDPIERAEQESLLDIYKAALGMLPLEEYADRDDASQSYAEAKGRDAGIFISAFTTTRISDETNEILHTVRAPSDPNIVVGAELTDTQEQPEEPATQSQPIDTVHGSGAAAKGLAGPACAQDAETANTKPAPNSPSPETPQATADEDASRPAASSAPNPNPQPNLLPGAVKAPEADSSPASGAVLSEAEIPQFLKADRGFNNPRCKHPDTCSKAHSKDTCLDCTLAWADLPKAEQVLRWQEAMEAASETEAV